MEMPWTKIEPFHEQIVRSSDNDLAIKEFVVYTYLIITNLTRNQH